MPNKKNNKKNIRTKLSKLSKENMPFVSVCTPTYNRRPFIKSMIRCFNHQTYPSERLEWIILDDGTDKIEDLVGGHPNVKYYKYDEKITLGKKRNMMHEKCKGDIIIYMDDDDYYPPERIYHAVDMLLKKPKALCAGSSTLYLYFKTLSKMYIFGPYGPRHATAGTFAFRKELLEQTKYEDDKTFAEEKSFLKDYTVPFVQLDPKKTILVFAHRHNTYDKHQLIKNVEQNKFVNESDKTVNDFVKDPELLEFYTNVV